MSATPSGPSRPPARASLRGWWWLVGLSAFLLLTTPILAVNAPQDVRIPPLKERTVPAPALFSHWGHNSLHCYSCHPGTFPQARLGFTHQDMREGRFCGSCHDGQAAKALSAMGCEACHARQ
jgi:c(7)-type cytochrome triheme protein